MSRRIVLSNGELHVGINAYGLVHDFYYPYVGLENHAAGKNLRNRVGVWINGRLSWLDDDSWTTTTSYPHHALIGHTVAQNDELGIILEFDDAVDAKTNSFLRNIHVINTVDSEREIRIFLHQAFAIGDSRSNTDTAQFLPDTPAILHYRGRRAFIIAAEDDTGRPFDQHSVGLFGIEGHESVYRDADDGELSMSNVEHGRVDSIIRFRLDIPAHSSRRLYYWIAAGMSTREALSVHQQIKHDGIDSRLDMTAHWWRKWLVPANKVAERIDALHRETFLKSVMIVKSQIDKRGAVIASTDTTMLNYWRDVYAYCWPRDGAYVLWPLIRMGYRDEPERFFDFCRRNLTANGYLAHKYRADGAVGSSWHPYLHSDGTVAPPTQEDETALVVFVFSQYYQMHKDEELLKQFYEPMVLPMANYLASYIDERTGLPKPSYDLWEEQFLTTTYTTAVTYAALLAAADLADLRQDDDSAVRWRSAADDMYDAAHKLLFNKKRQAFYKGLYVNKDGSINYNETIDSSSIYGSFMFGLFPAQSNETKAAIGTLENIFGIGDANAGVPRYENDNYCRSDDRILGNYWPIASLWLAQYYTEVGRNDDARRLIDWVRDQAYSTGVMSEQIDPNTGKHLSVGPLTWSQAEYIATLLDTIAIE